MSQLRADLALISDWIKPNSRVLDLGCGDGSLLRYLIDERAASGYGLELDVEQVTRCIEKGVNVIHSDLNAGLADFDADSFDYVLMTQALQMVHRPDLLLDEMLRIGKQGIVTFPNFGYWRCRMAILRGRMPVTKGLPSKWFNTANKHLCTLKDFEALCAEKGIPLHQRAVLDSQHRRDISERAFPNLLGEIALYRFGRDN